MSSYSVADFVTGRNLASGTPCVGFLVTAQTTLGVRGSHLNSGAIRPADYFMPESFAIFGTAEDSGMLDVIDESQFAVRMALRMTGTTSWEELSENAFNERRGVQLMGTRDAPNSMNPNRRTYGLALMHRETYDYLVLGERSALATNRSSDGYQGEHRVRADRAPDMAKVKSMLDICMARVAEIEPIGDDPSDMSYKVGQLWDLSCIFGLRAEAYALEKFFPSETNHPRLIQALSSSDGSLFGEDLRATLRTVSIIGPALSKLRNTKADDLPELDGLLGHLWDCMHLKSRLYDVHAHFRPSSYAGQDDNGPSILALGRETSKGVWKELTANVRETGNGGAEKLRVELEAMEAMVAEMRLQFEACRA